MVRGQISNQEQEKRNLLNIPSEQKEPSCSQCIHFKVCGAYRGIAPLINNSFPPVKDPKTGGEKDTRPFKPEELAKICVYYNPSDV